MKARNIYEGSDGAATKLYYADLETRGPVGLIAVNLLRAQKASARAKLYRGGIRGQGSFKRMAYERKAWSLANLCTVLSEYRSDPKIRFGWKQDPLAEFSVRWVLYVDLPNGQVSFHSVDRYAGPDYPDDWDGLRLSCDRILAFCDAVMSCTCPNLCDCENPEPTHGAALVSNLCPDHNLYPEPSEDCQVHPTRESRMEEGKAIARFIEQGSLF
jgi:hypothetical protein